MNCRSTKKHCYKADHNINMVVYVMNLQKASKIRLYCWKKIKQPYVHTLVEILKIIVVGRYKYPINTRIIHCYFLRTGKYSLLYKYIIRSCRCPSHSLCVTHTTVQCSAVQYIANLGLILVVKTPIYDLIHHGRIQCTEDRALSPLRSSSIHREWRKVVIADVVHI